MAEERIGRPCPGPGKVPPLLTLTKNLLESLLFKFVDGNDLENVEIILSVLNLSLNSKANLELDSNSTTFDTPLTLATRKSNIDIMKCLIDHGASVDQGSYDGTTPLFIAVSKGDLESVKLLIKSGCDVNKGNRYCKVY